MVFKSLTSRVEFKVESKEIVNIIFSEDLLKKIDSSEYVTLFAHLKINFIEKNEEETEFSVD